MYLRIFNPSQVGDRLWPANFGICLPKGQAGFQVFSSSVLSVILLFCRILLSIRETGGDWADGQHGRGDPILKGEKDPKTGPTIKIPERDVGPSSTQVLAQCQLGAQVQISN